VGQPLLAVLVNQARTFKDSQEWLSHKFVVSRGWEAYDAAESGYENSAQVTARLTSSEGGTMAGMRIFMRSAAAVAGLGILLFSLQGLAADILDDWSSVKAPPPIEVKAVTLEGPTTALLILDMMKMNCGARPRCVASVPAVKKLNTAARTAGAMVWYSFVGSNNMATPADQIDPALTAKDGEWVRQNGPDKFIGSNLEEKLKARGIKTVIVCGTSFQGVGIGTGGGAAQRGYKVVIPIDCLSSEDTYMEQYAAFHLFKGGPAGVTSQVTVTRTSMMKF
jgi:nicotinamidase-related amidase